MEDRFPFIQEAGRWVVFGGSASNRVPGDDNGMTDIFVRDVDSGAIVRVGVNSLSVSPLYFRVEER